MSNLKFYAVHTPMGDRIVGTWAECERLTYGVKGNLYKSFPTREAAQEWLDGVTERHPPEMLRIYVDGSFVPGFDRAGWAFIAVENGVEIASESGVTEHPAESRNIDGELAASLHALDWLRRTGRGGVICHDYEGIARWAKGKWLAKTPIAVRYRDAVRAYPNARFEKVPAHSGIRWNEMADGGWRMALPAPPSLPPSVQSGRPSPRPVWRMPRRLEMSPGFWRRRHWNCQGYIPDWRPAFWAMESDVVRR